MKFTQYRDVTDPDERTKYRAAYRRGWKYSESISTLDNHKGLDGNPYGGLLYWAWEDGYLDHAGDRVKGHRLTCDKLDHSECPRV